MEFFGGALQPDGPNERETVENTLEEKWKSLGGAQPLLTLKPRVRIPQALFASTDNLLAVVEPEGLIIIVNDQIRPLLSDFTPSYRSKLSEKVTATNQ